MQRFLLVSLEVNPASYFVFPLRQNPLAQKVTDVPGCFPLTSPGILFKILFDIVTRALGSECEAYSKGFWCFRKRDPRDGRALEEKFDNALNMLCKLCVVLYSTSMRDDTTVVDD